MVAQLILVQLIEVRVLAGEPFKDLNMRKLLILLLLIFSSSVQASETGFVFDWSDGLKIQTRPDSKFSQREMKYLEQQFGYLNSRISQQNHQLKLYASCIDNDGGKGCVKYLKELK